MSSARSHFHRTADGTVWTFLAESLILPTGLISAAYLTRALGPDGYGLFSLAATLAAFAGSTAISLFARGSIKLVAEADDWRPVATTILRMHLACGVVASLLVLLLARPIAAALDEPRLAFYLMLFSIDPLLLVTARAHRSVLIGIGRFREQVVPVAIRPVARLLLIILLVECGLSISGAVLGLLGASLIELVAYRVYVRPRLFPASSCPAREIWNEATVLFFAAVFLSLFARIDLFALPALGLPTREAGYYGAAQNLSIVPSLFAMSFTPLLLSTMSKMVSNGEHEHARILSRDAIRLVLGMVPFAAMASGASHEVVLLIFGANFAAAGPLLAWLIFGQVAAAMIAVAFVVLIVAQRPGWSTVIAGPMLALALAGHYLLVPRFGSIGAAWVTTTLEIVGALGALWIVYRVRRVLPPLATVIRTVLIASAAWLAATSWSTDGMGLVVKLGLISIGIAAAYWFMREFKPTELAWARAIVRRSLA
ncbi:MAG: oligosaccharide flippase family protein [Burkholderiales bacterium]